MDEFSVFLFSKWLNHISAHLAIVGKREPNGYLEHVLPKLQ